VIDEEDEVVPRLVICNNCGVIHKVIDICKTEIAIGNDSMRSVMTKEQIGQSLHPNIVGLLDAHECDISVWEHVSFIVQNEIWGSILTITQEDIGGMVQAKTLEILAADRVRLQVQTRIDEIAGGSKR
jgi:hypothetical protein